MLRSRYAFSFGAYAYYALCGVIFLPLAALVQYFFPASVSGSFVRAFLLVALPEEGAKLAAVLVGRVLLRRMGRTGPSARSWTRAPSGGLFREAAGGVPAGIAASLGFAFFESAAILVGAPGAAALRALVAAPLHGACGAWVGAAAEGSRTNRGGVRVVSFLVAVGLHGAYDLSLFLGLPFIVAVAVSLLALGLSAVLLLRDRSSGSPLGHHPLKGSPSGDD